MTNRTASRGSVRRSKARPRSRRRLSSDLAALFPQLGRLFLRASRAHDGHDPAEALPPLRRAARLILSVTNLYP
jgi:hypothetical protein